MKNYKLMQKVLFLASFLLSLSLCFSACGKKETEKPQISENDKEDDNIQQEEPEPEKPIEIKDLSQYIEKDSYRNQCSLHDISLFKDGNLYYAFGSYMAAADSSDLWNWSILANGVTNKNKLFTGLLKSDAFSWCGKNENNRYSMWSPDVIYNSKMRKYCMYFAVSGEDDKASICLATADNISGPYTFRARILDSGFSTKNVSKTLAGELFGKKAANRNYFDKNGNYDINTCPAALDPCVFYDADGSLWLIYGSWAGGIYMLELNKKTGLPIHPKDAEGTDTYFGTHILGYGNDSCEAPYIMYHKDSGYYYLFVSYGNISNDGGYDIREFRSQNVNGPYLDATGQKWTEQTENHDSFGVRIISNYQLPSNAEGYVSGGHPAVIADSDGRILLIHHTRFDDNSGNYELRIRQMFLNEAGWLLADPFPINNLPKKEILKENGYGAKKLYGTYYIINHGNEITADIKKAKAISLEEDNVILGVEDGYWEKIEGMPYANITIDNQTYQGVFIKQKDENGHKVMVFTGICDRNNQSIWAVKYLELGERGETIPLGK